MRKTFRNLVLVAALALACVPFAWERLVVAPADAQFQAWTQSVTLINAATSAVTSAAFDTSGAPIVAVQLSGTFVASVTFEGSIDGTNWNNVFCYPTGSSTGTQSAIAAGIWRCNMVGIPAFRARMNTYTSGTLTVRAFATQSYFPLGTNVP